MHESFFMKTRSYNHCDCGRKSPLIYQYDKFSEKIEVSVLDKALKKDCRKGVLNKFKFESEETKEKNILLDSH